MRTPDGIEMNIEIILKKDFVIEPGCSNPPNGVKASQTIRGLFILNAKKTQIEK